MTYQSFLRPFVERQAEPHTMTADDATDALMAAFAEGLPWAVTAVHEAARARVLRNIKEQRQAPHRAMFIDDRGRRRTVNTAVSRPMMDDLTGDVVGHQLVLEWDMGAAQLNAVLAQLRRDAREVQGRVNVVRALLAVLEAHPECETARCAWLADGRSISEIDLSA